MILLAAKTVLSKHVAVSAAAHFELKDDIRPFNGL
jgi:hypothetical protein